MGAGWRVRAALSLLGCAALRETDAQEDVLKIPVTVDQAGKSIYFVTDASSDVAAEAARFCRAHLPTLEVADCAEELEKQVQTVRTLRRDAQLTLPGISFSVRSPESGEELRFVHEEGADPVAEATEFCKLHFPNISEKECIPTMLRNAQEALDEVEARYGGIAGPEDFELVKDEL